MKIQQFDVIELNNNNKATVLYCNLVEKKYLIEEIDKTGKTEVITINESNIKKIIYKH